MKRWLKQNRKTLVFLIGFAFFRTAMADWNPIPSGSMHPTLLEGDVVLVNRLAYDFKLPLTDICLLPIADPRRGDVVTFDSPKDGVRLIKRLVAIPGDIVEMRDERLFINGVGAEYSDRRITEERLDQRFTTPGIRQTERIAGNQRTVQLLPGVPAMRDFGPVTVAANHYFFLGDNRDDSADSRYIGSVDRSLLIGRAHRVLVSADIEDHWQPRFARFGEPIR
ncbi:signal peptidase I [soil metagenome]